MKAMDALSHNKREYERGIKNLETQNSECCSKIHEAQMQLEHFRKTSRKESNDLKREIKVSKIKIEAELKVKEEQLKKIEAENAEIFEYLDGQLQIIASDKGSIKLTKG